MGMDGWSSKTCERSGGSSSSQARHESTRACTGWQRQLRTAWCNSGCSADRAAHSPPRPTLALWLSRAAVQMATWVKRTFGLKPALERARKERREQRVNERTTQVDGMF